MFKKLLIIAAFVLFLLPISVNAKNRVDLYFFRGEGCPHCAKEEITLEYLQNKYDNLVVHDYEIWYNKENQQLLKRVEKLLDKRVTGVPFTVIGTATFSGFSEELTPSQLEEAIIFYSDHEITDSIGNMLDREIKLPIFGIVDPKNVSMPIITMVIGFLDGLNPCSMWVLLFMMSIYIGMHNRKKLAYIGLTYILTSSLIYFLFMAAWLNLTSFIGGTIWLRYLIALVALIGGFINIRSALKNRKDAGCEVVDDKKRMKILDRIKHFTKQKSFIIAIIGTIVLTLSVSLIDMLCSAGLPVIYLEILDINNVSYASRYLYFILYILFFMLDDIIVYLIALKTMKLKGISTKFGIYSHYIGGIIMIIIGILLILKPGWLMFG